MFENIENLKLISASQGIIKTPSKVENKKMHSFVYRVSGKILYNFSDNAIIMNKGDLIFLPKGSSYEIKILTDQPCEYFSISFEASIEQAKPIVFSLDNFTDMGYICNHYVNLWKLGNQSEKFKCYSLFYNILSCISTIQDVSYSDSKKFDLLTPALDYLKQHIFDADLKTNSLHKLCGISDTYFRRIFVSKFGDTPQKYITNRRLAYAKSILDSERTESIGEIAQSVGYTDPLYFSRAFKKKYGISPTNSERDL